MSVTEDGLTILAHNLPHPLPRRYLRDSLHFIDKNRVGVWGWSYGGFVAAMLLSQPNQDIFQCGISVAPVTSWRLYGMLLTPALACP